MDARLIRILLVEDDEDDVILTQHALKSAKFTNQVAVARDGVEALQQLRQQPPYAESRRPDLILLDLNMPRMDGRDFLKELRADTDLRTIPVVVMTTSQDEADVHKAYDLGANCYITKPVDLEKFRQVVQNIEEFWFGIVRLPPRPHPADA